MINKISNRTKKILPHIIRLSLAVAVGIALSFAITTMAVNLPLSSNFDTGNVLRSSDLKAIVQNIEDVKNDLSNRLLTKNTTLKDKNGKTYQAKQIITEDANENALSLFVFDTNQTPKQNRVAIWGKNIPLDINAVGYDDTPFALSVFGDVALGDIKALAKNPMRYFQRVEGGLEASDVTILYSSKNVVVDGDGGSFIQMSPLQNGSGINDGYLNFTAYGKGGGSLSNTSFFRARSGVNQIEDVAYIKGRNSIGVNQTAMSALVNFGNRFEMRDIYIGAPDSAQEGFRTLMIIN